MLGIERPQTRLDRARRATRGGCANCIATPGTATAHYLDDPHRHARLLRKPPDEEDRVSRGRRAEYSRQRFAGRRFSDAPAGRRGPTTLVPLHGSRRAGAPIERQPRTTPRQACRAGVGLRGRSAPPPSGQGPRAVDLVRRARGSCGLQFLLDRKGASPGVIDGRFGSNVDKALAAYREITGEQSALDRCRGDQGGSGEPAATPSPPTRSRRKTRPARSWRPFPADYSQKAKLDRLGYTSVPEMLAERFHMDEAYLKALNPDAFLAGPAPSSRSPISASWCATPVARIVADKAEAGARL